MVAKGATVRKAPDHSPYEINLIGTEFSDRDLSRLRGYQQLKNLSLKESSISDAGLSGIANLSQLKSLNLSGTSITDEGLKELAGLSNLQMLNLTETNVSDKGLPILNSLDQLGSLVLDRCSGVTFEGLLTLKKHPQIRHVSIKGLEIDYSQYLRLREQVPGVSFEIEQNAVLKQKPENILQIKWTEHPEKLSLSVREDTEIPQGLITKEMLAQVPWRDNVTSLQIQSPHRFDTDSISVFQLYVALEQIIVHVDTLSDVKLTLISKCKNLQSINLSTTSIDQDEALDLAPLGRLAELKVLSILGNQVQFKNTDSLTRLNSLKRLSLIQCNLTDDQITFLKQLPQLESIDFYGNQLTNEALKTLQSVTNLESADLRGNQISDEKIQEFLQFLSSEN